MAQGIFLFKDKDSQDANLMGTHYLENFTSEDLITTDLMNKISLKHGVFSDNGEVKKIISYRTDDIKFLSLYAGETNDNDFLFLTYILEVKESSEVFKISIGETQQLIIMAYKKGKDELDKILSDILNSKNELVVQIRAKDKIQKLVTSQANELLDAGSFERAQSFITLAKELPGKITDSVKKGDSALKSGNYRLAEKSYNEAAELSQKINQYSMSKLLKQMAKRAAEIPRYKKNWSQLFTKIQKPLRKMDKREKHFYLDPINTVNNAIDIADNLEDDTAITNLTRLEELLKEGDMLSEKLTGIDKEINGILKKIKK